MNIPNAITRKPSIRAANLRKRFESGKFTIDVIKGVTLDVLPAELTLVVGPSGSGKSTLLSMLSGLLKPDSGEVEVLGQQIWGLSDNEIDQFRLAHCGFVFQGFNLFPALTAREQVAMPLQYLPALAAQAEQLADAALAQVGLAHRAHLRPLELSGGEKQRVAIARAIAKRPRLLFADEPTSALDGTNGQIVVDLLHQIARRDGSSVLCVSHDPRVIQHADRVMTIDDGLIVSDKRCTPRTTTPLATDPVVQPISIA